ncbi:MAG: 4Fe-4S dicluster domain-containing protein [Bacteroidales bacterium]|nr:4Fe-4S dicluster domain-containing protein [Bacteroidales bacterium]MCF8328435.1 4Fe-4S dicluster domain-containing protein [Bacteroidales bacterium]
METLVAITKSNWKSALINLIDEYVVYAPYRFWNQLEYGRVTKDNIGDIVYNQPKPSSPLKSLFLPIRENVVNSSQPAQKRIIMGAPACDLSALSILDEIYLNHDYPDPNYMKYRENTILIGFDCHTTNEHCHCTSYGFHPYPTENSDLVISLIDDNFLISAQSDKGLSFLEKYLSNEEQAPDEQKEKATEIRENIEHDLREKNKDLPDYDKTGEVVMQCGDDIWDRYSDTCVSCGACSAICPTCSCFLLIERPEFEKVRSLDTCQYPGFERVAAGEDPLRPLPKRFRNRYMCKYVWKPEKFQSKACTGCGRCIEACIGEINKNDLFKEQFKNLSIEA